MKYNKKQIQLLSDFYTPVSLYMRVRQKYLCCQLLESSDYSSKENSHSFICFDSMESLILENGNMHLKQDGQEEKLKYESGQLKAVLKQFMHNIDTGDPADNIFGYCNYEVVSEFENIQLNEKKKGDGLPEMRYDFFRFIIKFDHFHERLTVTEYIPQGDESQMDDIIQLIQYQHTPEFEFSVSSEEKSNLSDQEFIDNVIKAKEHLQKGDVFQIVLSRSFECQYMGDVFNVYRQLRSINPSPYLYYFDYGSYKIFGSSPEAQIVIKNNTAEIHPIAGTVRRTGDLNTDILKAESLSADPKENAEHVMLVDLARNDLSKHGKNIRLKKYKEIQYFSHVIHLTSVVEADLPSSNEAIDIYADTFPAGTLSGAPKYKAMQLIDALEKTKRGFYGGAIGILGLNGDINKAILIRSFLASDKKLRYQAGAGIVISSNEQNELKEVNNKLAALKLAIHKASKHQYEESISC